MNLDKLLRFWDRVITGESFQENVKVSNDPDSIKDLLYKKTLRVMPKVVSALGIRPIEHKQNKEKVLKEIFEASCKIDPEPWSFFMCGQVEKI